MNDKMLVVDITLKNNRGILNNCVVFKENGVDGQPSIQTIEEIENVLNEKLSKSYMACVQNSYVNASIFISYIEKYTIREIDRDDF